MNPHYRSPPLRTASHTQGRASPRFRVIAIAAAVVAALVAIWSGVWFYAAGEAETTVAAWRGHEAEAGRNYECSHASFGGYPFRMEYDCADPAVDDRAASLSVRARHLAAFAQVWDPTLVTGEIAGPVTLAPLGAPPVWTIDWSLAQASLRGRPGAPERLWMLLQQPKLAAAEPGGGLGAAGGAAGAGSVVGGAAGADPLVKADRAELQGHFAADSTPSSAEAPSLPTHQVLDLSFDVSQVTAPGLVTALGTPLAALAAGTTDAKISAVLRGADGLAPKPMAQLLRELQQTNGRLEIVSARLSQGDVIAAATGTLRLAPRGTLDGELRLTVINFDKLVPLLGIDKMLGQALPLETARIAPGIDRLLSGLGKVLRGGNAADGAAGPSGPASPNAGTVTVNAAAAALGAAALGGQPAELEGQRAMTLTLRFDDGAAFLGPLKLGQVPPLY